MMEAVRAEIARRAAEAERVRIQNEALLLRARCVSLSGFVREAWHVLEPTARYVHGWHMDAICAHLEAVTDGRINRLLINVPPGSSKSLLVSVLWPAWEWGPRGMRSMRYLATSFNDGPVKRDTRKSRDLILSDWYRTLWPEVTLTRAGETSFANSDTGTREGVAFGSLTSQRGDRLIIDDPHSTETAESPTERAATTRRFREGALNRLNDQDASAIVVVMQRLHEEDISGTILNLGMGFEHLMLPMEFEPDRARTTSIGFIDPRKAAGDLLDPNRFPRATVEALKRDMGSYAFAGQYQQRPAPREGGMFKRRWFSIVDTTPARLTRIRRWDLASTASNGSNDPDWTVGLLMGRDPEGFVYVEHVERFRGSPHEVERAILATAEQDGRMVGVRLPQDPGQAGKSQSEYLIRKLAGYDARAERETGSKQVRATPFAAQCEAGNVRLVRGDWNEAFLAELETFPMAAHDDQVDAASGAFTALADGFDLGSYIRAYA